VYRFSGLDIFKEGTQNIIGMLSGEVEPFLKKKNPNSFLLGTFSKTRDTSPPLPIRLADKKTCHFTIDVAMVLSNRRCFL
jgi:hypothetical protein